MGSSNFTTSGLSENQELNLVIQKDDACFEGLVKVGNEYWNKAQVLDLEVIKRLEELLLKYGKSNAEGLEEEIAEITSSIKKTREFTSIHKARISAANKGKRGPDLTAEWKRKMNEAAAKAMSKPVICINDHKKYMSLQEASNAIYTYVRGYGYISDVCSGKKEHYKNYVWRFEEDYLQMSQEEKDKLDELVADIMNRHKKTKRITKLLFRGKTFESYKNLGIELRNAGLIRSDNKTRPEQSISALIKQASELELPYFRMHNEDDIEYIFFAEYEIIEQEDIRLDESPVRSSVEEYEDEYMSLFDLEFGDITLSDLLWSKAKKFYKIEEIYYKSRSNVLKDYVYDKKVDKKKAIELIENGECIIEDSYEVHDIRNSSKQFYYLRNNILFKTKDGYALNRMVQISKEEILNEIGMLL